MVHGSKHSNILDVYFQLRLRDETTGRPLLDPVTKREMFEKEES